MFLFSWICLISGGGGASSFWTTTGLKGMDLNLQMQNKYIFHVGLATQCVCVCVCVCVCGVCVFFSVFLSLSFYCRCGKRFCHFTQEGHQMVNGLLAPVFRVTRKRKVLTKVRSYVSYMHLLL